MGFWEILGGVTARAGNVAGAVGRTADNAVSRVKKKVKRPGADTGTHIDAAKNTLRVQKLRGKIEMAIAVIKEDKAYHQLIVALHAVGLAVANADGSISEAEVSHLEQFVTGVSSSGLPSDVKNAIIQLKDNPPNFNTAMEFVKQLKNPDLEMFEQVIGVVAESDGRLADEEVAFLEAFRRAAS